MCTGEWRFGVSPVAPARLLLDGEVVLDNAELPVGGSFFGIGRAELTESVAGSKRDATYRLDVEMRHRPTPMYGLSGLHIGALAPVTGDPVAGRSTSRPRPTWRSWSSAPTTTGRARGGTATTSSFPAARTN